MRRDCRAKSYTLRISLFLSLLLSGCATLPKSHFTAPSWTEIYTETPSHLDATGLTNAENYKKANDDMRTTLGEFRAGNISQKSLKTSYDDFEPLYKKLRDYRLIVQPDDQLLLPANSQVKINITWYCLHASDAFPSKFEFATWEKSDLGIPYYKEILRYASRHAGHEGAIQGLIWGLMAKVPYSEFTPDKQAILDEIDPQAAIKLTAKSWASQLKDYAVNQAKEYAATMPTGQAVSKVYSQYQDYESQARDLMNRTSQFPPIHLNDPEIIDPDPLFATAIMSGWSGVFTLYNTGILAQKLDLTHYFRLPSRSDVQRQALVVSALPKALQDILSLMDITDKEVRPLVYPPAEPGPTHTTFPPAEPGPTHIADPIPPQEPPVPIVTPVPDQPPPVQGDPIPPQQPALGYYTTDAAGNRTPITRERAAQATAAVTTIQKQLGKEGILLGEDMPGRVIPLAEEIGTGTYDPIPNTPKKDWLNLDRQWLREMMRLGKTIYDIGVAPLRPGRLKPPASSEYYRAERQELVNAGYKQIFVQDVSFKIDGVEHILKLYQWIPPR
jgi:hypothetical protein